MVCLLNHWFTSRRPTCCIGAAPRRNQAHDKSLMTLSTSYACGFGVAGRHCWLILANRRHPRWATPHCVVVMFAPWVRKLRQTYSAVRVARLNMAVAHEPQNRWQSQPLNEQQCHGSTRVFVARTCTRAQRMAQALRCSLRRLFATHHITSLPTPQQSAVNGQVHLCHRGLCIRSTTHKKL